MVGFLQQHGSWYPKFPNFDSLFSLVLFSVPQFEKLGTALNVIQVRVGKSNNIKEVAPSFFQLIPYMCREIKGLFGLILGLATVTEVK